MQTRGECAKNIFGRRCKKSRKLHLLYYEGQNETEGLRMAIQIVKAKRQMARLKIGVAGSSGSGKT